MILVLACGALAGVGALLLVLQFDHGTGTAAAELARLDAARQRSTRTTTLTADRRHQTESQRLRRVGSTVRAGMEARGWKVPAGVRADLAVMGRSVETHLGMSVLAGVAGLFAPAVALSPLIYAFDLSLTIPLWLALVGGAGGFVLATAQLSTEAKERRRDFRHVVSAFLDLVSMNLAGGRGVPEALSAAAGLSDGWAMVRLRDAMESARLQGVTPWAALGDLGDEMAVKELSDLAAALALVAEDGAKVRQSLAARAASMRQRELTDAEGRAEQQSQSMLVAQLLLCLGFLLFLIYPAIANVVGV
ncbi:bacterial type II secretion system domain protein F [Aeromicrobium marinum DSM 15272]|uniref:Bacterial type II secretion system domain protein F n=1 Tax=Aeromicrobium marinum DSM 15272 TaxID=585531 RepID=E2SCX0_9ACTN|nr:type II secretion system F family protein [Aeromicrobium marinum]EFQ83073.1 bacterial type II secretion system domain protein F [Aeromicrobium marinum DSM 15272]